MKNALNSKGYSLLLTMLAIVIITVISVSLMTLTTSGLASNENRENTALASDLSEKGIDFLTNQINQDLEAYIKDLKNNKTTVDTVFTSIYAKYSCSLNNGANWLEIEGSTGKTKVCIEHIEDKTTAANNKRGNTRLVTVRSVGESNKTKQAALSTVLELGYSDIPEQLSYAVSSNDKGNIYFFGGTEIQGNVKLSGDIYVSEKAFYSDVDKPIWVQSVKPKLLSYEVNKPPLIYTNKDYIYNFKETMPSNVESIYKLNNESTTQFSNNIQKVTLDRAQTLFLGDKPTVKKFMNESKPVIIHEKKDPYKNEKSKFEEMLELKAENISQYEGPYTLSNGAHKVESNKVFYIKHKYKSNCKTCIDKAGNLIIGNQSSNNSPSTYSSTSIEGNYYVDGNVEIKGAKLKANAVIYAKGNVNISFSTIEPLNNGTLFIFADGKIQINNISVESLPGKGSIINGYFYSNNDFLMYGVGSNTTITGGVSARNIIYTTVRGNAQGKGLDIPYEVPKNCEAFALNCIKLIKNKDNPTYEVTKQQIDITLDWLNKLQNKVYSQTGKRPTNYYYETSHNIGQSKSITNTEIHQIKELLENHQKINTSHLQLINKVKQLASTIPSSLKEFNYTKDKLYSINRNDLLEYKMGSNQTTISNALNGLYDYSYTIFINTCLDNKSNLNCSSILDEYIKYHSTDSVENQLVQPSRLTIKYDRDLVERFRKTTEDDYSAVQDLTISKPKVHSKNEY